MHEFLLRASQTRMVWSLPPLANTLAARLVVPDGINIPFVAPIFTDDSTALYVPFEYVVVPTARHKGSVAALDVNVPNLPAVATKR